MDTPLPEKLDFSELVDALKSHLGITVTPYANEPADVLIGKVDGDILGSMTAQIKANAKVCTFMLVVSDIRPDDLAGQGNEVFLGLLELNFKHPFGRISVAGVPGVAVNRPESTIKILVCETMFFWVKAVKDPLWFKEKVHERLSGLVRLHADASLAMRRARG